MKDESISIFGVPCKYIGKDRDTGRVHLLCDTQGQYSVDAKLYKQKKQFDLSEVMLVSSAPKKEAYARSLREKSNALYQQVQLPPEYLPIEQVKHDKTT